MKNVFVNVLTTCTIIYKILDIKSKRSLRMPGALMKKIDEAGFLK